MEGGADDFKTEDADDAGGGIDLRCDHLGQEMEDIVGKGWACHTVLPHNVIGRRIPRENERSALCRCTKCRTDGCRVTSDAAEDEERMVGGDGVHGGMTFYTVYPCGEQVYVNITRCCHGGDDGVEFGGQFLSAGEKAEC